MMNLEKEIRQQPEVLSRVLETNKATFDAAAKAIKEKGDITNVVFAARGTSDHACIYAQYLFQRYLGIPCGLATSSVNTKYGAKVNYKNTLLIAVSQSGMAKDVLTIVESAKECGALTITITNNTESPLASAGDFHLFIDAGHEKSIAATKTFTSQLYILAKLCQVICGDKELGEELDSVPGAVAELLDYLPEQMLCQVERYRFMREGVVVGRGMNYPIALEGALKIMETNNLKISGYAISDFQHGPLAQMNKNVLGIVIAAKGPCLDDAQIILDKLAPTECDTLILTDSDEFVEKYDNCLKVPTLASDNVSPFMFALAVQLIALELTKVRGVDPDNSQVLNKITVTK